MGWNHEPPAMWSEGLAATTESRLPRVVIVGAGFGGLEAAKALAGAPFAVTVIDRRNYHLFQPLLYQVATAALSPADIAQPIRGILSKAKNVNVLLADVTGVDLQHRAVLTDRGEVAYDHLILATGARHAYFGHDEWEPFAPALKKIEDATEVRRRILISFERAETEKDTLERTRHLTFVIVGGGPTGVELAGAIAELAKYALASDFRHIDPRDARIVLVEAGARLLPTFDPKLSEYARKALGVLGVEVILGEAVTEAGPMGVRLDGKTIESRTIIWAAGVRASAAGKWLNVETDRAGRVIVAPDLSVPGHSETFVIGDAALTVDENGKPLPGVATVAQQQGKHVAKLLEWRSRGKDPGPFRYRDPGSMATIGRSRAIAEIGGLKFTGFPAWVLWSLVHIYGLIGFRNRAVVALSWFWSYLTFERGMRLITGPTAGPAETQPANAESRVRDAA
jgi:NADH dehydrogenase